LSPSKRITKVSAFLAVVGASAIVAAFAMGMTGWPPAKAAASSDFWPEPFAVVEDTTPATIFSLREEGTSTATYSKETSIAESPEPMAASLAVTHSKVETPRVGPRVAKAVKRHGPRAKRPAKDQAKPKLRSVSRTARRAGKAWRSARASWYGPGFYGNTMAGGGKLRRTSMVVAHRSLPFGTKVQIKYRGRSVIATVRDRGPYISGRTFDLGPGTARKLKFGGVGTIRYRIVKR
jgi:rare lipoprotein A (peptidoglycan hydrolase)